MGVLRDSGVPTLLVPGHPAAAWTYREGGWQPDEALTHPRRNIVTRALGIDHEVDVDGFPIVVYRGDRFVLCSDGLYDEVDDARIASTLRRYSS